MTDYQVVRDGTGWSVIATGFYLYHRDREICEAVAALLNRDVKSAAEWIEQFRGRG